MASVIWWTNLSVEKWFFRHIQRKIKKKKLISYVHGVTFGVAEFYVNTTSINKRQSVVQIVLKNTNTWFLTVDVRLCYNAVFLVLIWGRDVLVQNYQMNTSQAMELRIYSNWINLFLISKICLSILSYSTNEVFHFSNGQNWNFITHCKLSV